MIYRYEGKQTRYATWYEATSATYPNSKGIIAPPIMPETSKEDPIFVNLPRSAMAKGQIAGHINALATPRNATRYMEIPTGSTAIIIVTIVPVIVDNSNAILWCTNFGINTTPNK